MTNLSEVKSPTSLLILVAESRFFTVSILIHVALIIVFGSVVLFEQATQLENFSAGDGGSFLEEGEGTQAEPMSENDTDSTEVEVMVPATPLSAPSTPMTAITTMAPSSYSFTTPSKLPSSLDRNLGSSFAKRLSDLGSSKRSLSARGGLGLGSSVFFGSRDSVQTGSLVGTMYDLKQKRNKKPSGVNDKQYGKIVEDFANSNFRESILKKYFHSSTPLYATQVMMPTMRADEGPKAFGLEKEVEPGRWVVHYKGRVSPPKSGTYRFVGASDDVLIVRFNGKLVLDGSWTVQTKWKEEVNYKYGSRHPSGYARGDAMKVREGSWYDIEILIGEQPGGWFWASLLIEEEGGASYKKTSSGSPILPYFRVSSDRLPKLEEGQTLPPYMKNGPVWNAEAGRSR